MEIIHGHNSFAYGVKVITKIRHEGTLYWVVKQQFANEWKLAVGPGLTDLTEIETLYKPNGEYKEMCDPDMMIRPARKKVVERAKELIRSGVGDE